jgi:hypothetical protein
MRRLIVKQNIRRNLQETRLEILIHQFLQYVIQSKKNGKFCLQM